MAKREYELKTVSKAIEVFEALADDDFKPVKISEMIKRTGFERHIVEWNLKTFQKKGWVIQTEQGEWCVGKKFVALALIFQK